MPTPSTKNGSGGIERSFRYAPLSSGLDIALAKAVTYCPPLCPIHASRRCNALL